MDMKKGEQLELRGDGKLPSILVRADNLAEGVREAILRCYDFGARVETPKHKRGGSYNSSSDKRKTKISIKYWVSSIKQGRSRISCEKRF